MRWKKWAWASLWLVAGALISVAIFKFQVPPYGLLRETFYHWIRPAIISRPVIEPDLSSLHIHSDDQAARARARLVALLWPDGYPNRLPAQIETDIGGYEQFGAKRVDRLTIRMDGGVDSKVYRFIPQNPNGHLILYQRGHEGNTPDHDRNIRELVRQGFEVAALWMPLTGENSKPTIRHPAIGRLKLASHEHLEYVDAGGHPVRLFIEPVIVTLNHLAPNRYRSISMVGLSGGGWTTTLAAAVDTRIGKSFPVAGTLPLSMREDKDFGDFEQTAPAVYEIAEYLDLYAMGAAGGRRQLQILNEFDPCCFAGRGALRYAGAVDRASSGSFDVMIDSSHARHQISPAALHRIVEEIAHQGERRLPNT